MTPAGWAALLASAGAGLALRVALPVWLPAYFPPAVPTDRHDPRHLNAVLPFALIPLLFAAVAVVLLRLGYPVFQVGSQRPPNDGDTPGPA